MLRAVGLFEPESGGLFNPLRISWDHAGCFPVDRVLSQSAREVGSRYFGA
jgi:hypothetical protein